MAGVRYGKLRPDLSRTVYGRMDLLKWKLNGMRSNMVLLSIDDGCGTDPRLDFVNPSQCLQR